MRFGNKTVAQKLAAVIYLAFGLHLLAGGSLLSRLQNVMDRNKD